MDRFSDLRIKEKL